MIETNEYFEGKVKSLGFDNTSGKYTVGVMEEGSYKFGTSSNEEMTVVSGQLDIKMNGQDNWSSYTAGQQFNVQDGESFEVRAVGQTAYLCRYF